MTTDRPQAWKDGWTAADPADIRFAWAPNDGGEYVDDGRGLLVRDLGVDSASDGALAVRRLKVADPALASQWRVLDTDVDLIYILAGSVAIEDGDGAVTALERGGAAIHPGGEPYRLRDFSADFEAVHFTAPGRFDIVVGEAAREVAGAAPAGAVYTQDTDDQYVKGDGPRAYFLYRDLGLRRLTEDRIHLHIVRATEPGAGTGWHYHTMAQWFMVIRGSAVIRVEDQPRCPLGWGDAMCVGRGPQMRHNVTDFTSDYLVLEMCVPAVYETIAVDAPDDADAG